MGEKQYRALGWMLRAVVALPAALFLAIALVGLGGLALLVKAPQWAFQRAAQARRAEVPKASASGEGEVSSGG